MANRQGFGRRIAEAALSSKLFVPLRRAQASVPESEPVEEAKAKLPDPDKMVPIWHWTKKAVWVFLKTPGQTPLMAKLPHKHIAKYYADKLTWPGEKLDLMGKIDPATYKGPKNIYPIDWQPTHGKPKEPPDPAAHHAKAVNKPEPAPEQPEIHAVDDLPPDAPAHWDPEGPPEEDGSQWGLYMGTDAYMDPSGSYIYMDPDLDPKKPVLWGKKPGETTSKTVHTDDPGTQAKVDQIAKEQPPPPPPEQQPKPTPKFSDYDIPHNYFTIQSTEKPVVDMPWARGTWGANGYKATLIYHPLEPHIELGQKAPNIASVGAWLWSSVKGVTPAGIEVAKPIVPEGGWKTDNLPPGWDLGVFVDKHGTYVVKSADGAYYYLLPDGNLAEYDELTGKYQPIKYTAGEWEINHDAAPIDPETTFKQYSKGGETQPIVDVPKDWQVLGPNSFKTPEGVSVMWDKNKDMFVYMDSPWTPYYAQATSDQPEWVPKGWKLSGDDPNGYPLLHGPNNTKLSVLDLDAGIFGIWYTAGYYALYKKKADGFANLKQKKSLIQVKAKPWDNENAIIAAGYGIAKGAVKNANDDGIPSTWKPLGKEDPHGHPLFFIPEFPSDEFSILPDGTIGLFVPDAAAYNVYEADEIGTAHFTGKQIPLEDVEGATAPPTTAKGLTDLPEGWHAVAAVDENGFDMVQSSADEEFVTVLPKEVKGAKFAIWDAELGEYDPVTLTAGGGYSFLSGEISLKDLQIQTAAPAPTWVPQAFMNEFVAEYPNQTVDFDKLGQYFINNQKLLAIKEIKDNAGAKMGLAQAKAMAEKLMADYFKANPLPFSLPVKTSGYTFEGVPKTIYITSIVQMIKSGQKLNATKTVRANTGWSLSQAKEWVESIEKQISATTSTQVKAGDLESKFKGSDNYTSEGHDDNGFPRFQSMTSGQYITVIPTGHVARWSKKQSKYYVLEEDTPGWWFKAEPTISFTLEEVLAHKHATDPSVASEPTQTIPSSWGGAGKNEHGHPMWTTPSGWMVTQLPGGKFGVLMSQGYKILGPIGLDGTFDFTGEVLNPDQAGADTPSAPTKTEPDVKIPPGWTLIDQKDVNGLLQITHPKHAPTVPRSILPSHSPPYYGRWLKSKQVYRLYKIGPKGNLISIKPHKYVTVHEAKKAPAAVTTAKTTSAFELSSWFQGQAQWAGVDVNGLKQVKVPAFGPVPYVPVGVTPPSMAKYMDGLEGYKVFSYKATGAKPGWHPVAGTLSVSAVKELQKSIGIPVPDEEKPAPPLKAPSVPKATKVAELPPSQTIAAMAEKLPDPEQLDLLPTSEQPSLGGAGKKWVFKDKSGNRYLFKPAWPKSGTKAEPHRAHAQEINALVANVIREDHVPLKTVRMEVPGASGKQIGTLQPFYEGATSLSGAKPSDLSTKELEDVIQDHVADWITSQHDTHAGNLMRLPDGRIVSVDKEQGFKYFDKFGVPGFQADVLDTDYHPNQAYGEQEPFYNKVWRAFENGEVDFDPMTLKNAFERMDKLHPDELEPALRAYANTSPGFTGKDAYAKEEFIAKVRSRKNVAKRDFEKFITEKYKKRTGEDGEFTFAQGWQPKGKKKFKTLETDLNSVADNPPGNKGSFSFWMDGVQIDVQVRNFSTEHGAPHDDPDLVTLKVQHGVGLDKLTKMVKMWGAEPVGDPLQGSAYLLVSVKRADLKKVGVFTQKVEIDESKTFQPHPGEAEYLPETDLFPAGDPNFDVLKTASTDKPLGLVGRRVFFDTDYVTGQTATFKRLKKGAKTLTQVMFRMNRQKLSSMSIKGSTMSYEVHAGTYSAEHDALDISGGASISSISPYFSGKGVTHGADKMVIVKSSSYAANGLVFADVYGSDVLGSLRTMLQDLVGQSVMEKILKPTTDADRSLMAARRLLGAMKPKTHDSLLAEDAPPEKWFDAITKNGLKEKLASVREVDGLESHLTHVLPGLWKEAKKNGEVIAKFCVHGTGDPSAVPPVLKAGLAGAVMRGTLGTTKAGAVNSTDWATGGADTTGIRCINRSFLGQPLGSLGGVGGGAGINFILSPDVLDRLDAVLHKSDSYQVTHPGGGSGHEKAWTGRQSMVKRLEWLDEHGGGNGHEIILMRGVTPKKIIRVVCVNESNRASVLSACAMEGVTEHNGIPISDFVVVESSLNSKSIYDKYVKPAGF